ncbi:hypothetical protein [Burkholderia multivorans]|uniref:hypothetical protein n=1 Tax=Burkholderia multivorans TaxID=87883 RepID=UPI0019CFA2CA|nr:hypothetical protein [Burkholderia multivorans]MBN6732581.1 hypothetical protein [Burkholderia multivorans]MBN6734180.1 hypothetical protein [Burkholderia multivorans]MBN7127575.1 hypothetical protein [Burkholderia multivorans]MBN8166398.1 hypothetical protein [Burkholderia multivorans]MBN8172188.1 hypothetical protein [Burkholderia multivorans]
MVGQRRVPEMSGGRACFLGYLLPQIRAMPLADVAAHNAESLFDFGASKIKNILLINLRFRV